jgi:hypothetical protein
VLSVLVNLVTLYALLRALRVRLLTALVFVAVALTTLQLRVYHDPILGFSLLYQVMLEFNLLSFTLFARYCQNRRRIELVASAFFFFMALFYYETSYPLSIVHVIIAARFGGWGKWRDALPFLGLSALFFALSLSVRHFVHMAPQAMYRLGLDPVLYLQTLAKQIVAAIPLSYIYFTAPHVFTSWWHVYDSAPLFLIVTVGIVSFAALAFPLLHGRDILRGESGLKAIAMIGAAFWFFSAVLVAVLPRYQIELQFGLGYLPVYFEYFGAALVFGSIAIALLRHLAERATSRQWQATSVATALVFAFVIATTYSANAFVINTFASEKYGRSFLSSAVESGLLRNVASGDRLFVNGTSESVRHYGDFRDAKYFFFQETGRKIDARSMDAIDEYHRCRRAVCGVAGRSAFVMSNGPLDARSGSAIVGRITAVGRVLQGGVSTLTPMLEDVVVFVSGPELGDRSRSAAYGIAWQTLPCRGAAGFAGHSARLDTLPDVRSGGDWRIVALPKACGAIPLASVGIFAIDR